jgi:hypothetical protein
LAGEVLDCHSLPGVPADRLFAQDVLALASRVTDDFEMQVIRSSDVHNFDGRIFDDPSPIDRLFLETKSNPSRTGSGFKLVCANNESGMKGALRKAFDNLPVRSAMCFTHPTHTDDANSYDTSHCLVSHGHQDLPSLDPRPISAHRI